MGRVTWLTFAPKSAMQKFLFPQKFCVGSSNCIPQFQRAFIHSPTCGYPYNNSGKYAVFAPSELLSWKRFIHATGVCLSVERDHYEILGISKDANRDEIKKAFHALAKKFHPDANKNNPSAKRKFQEIRDAYETLQDPEKKAEYDRIRENLGRSKKAEHSNRGWEQFRYAHRADFSDSFHKIFSEIFENEGDSTAADIQVEIELAFSEAAKGCTKHLSFDADVPCHTCCGRGHPLDAEPKVCPTCQGFGKVTMPPFSTTCRTCKGFGKVIKEYCIDCNGSGVCEGTKDVKVTIPAGVDSDDTIRVPKAGNAGGLGRFPGNLYIKIKVAEDPIFTRQGSDIYVDSHISFTQAILGGHVEVPTLSGKLKLRIPKGVQPGQLVSLRGKGLPRSGFFKDYGDQYVRFRIKFPTNVTERQHAILEEFEEEIMDENKTPDESNWCSISSTKSSTGKSTFSILGGDHLQSQFCMPIYKSIFPPYMKFDMKYLKILLMAHLA